MTATTFIPLYSFFLQNSQYNERSVNGSYKF